MVNQNIRDIAAKFLTMAAYGKVRDAYAQYVADSFVHHNAYFPSDRNSLQIAMEQSSIADPNKALNIKQLIVEGDRVVVFSHLQRLNTNQEYAVVHMLRFENNKIVEMWDVVQEVPKDSPNQLGMF